MGEADVKNETLEKDVSTKEPSKESKETKKNESDKKQGKKTKTEQETPSKGKKSKVAEEKEEESETMQNGEVAGSPDVSKDMFDDTDDENDVKGEAEKNSSLGLDEANKVARACLLETSSDEDTVQKKALLVGRNALLILNLGLHVVNGIARLDFKGDSLACECLDEDLHTTAEAEDEVKSGLFLDVVVRKSAAILELFTGEDEALLIRRDAFLVLDLSFNVVNSVAWLDLESDGLASESLNKDLHVFWLFESSFVFYYPPC